MINRKLEEVNAVPNKLGKAYLIKYLEGHAIIASQAIVAKCFDCMGYYADGPVDCNVEHCPLYPWMPYGKEAQK